MNKKLMTFGIGMFALALISAGYYVLNSDTFSVDNIDGMGTYTDNPVLGSVEFGNGIEGNVITLTNDLSNDRELLIAPEGSDDIAVEYKSTLELTKKDVDFTSDDWTVLEGKVNVEYTLVGDEFSAEVVTGAEEGYVLIYYADAEDRFVNPEVAILVGDVDGNLPYTTDENVVNDYSEEYVTSHGAKLWYVPSTAILGSNELDWSRASEFYFETKLIQYNQAGEITLYSGDSLDITPVYTPDEFASGEYTIETTIA